VITNRPDGSDSLALEAQFGGLLTDGMGTGGHNVSFSGQDRAVVQVRSDNNATDGKYGSAQLDLRALWISEPSTKLHVYVDGDDEGTVLSGTVLPPAAGGEGRRFRSKPGGKIEVLLSTDIADSLSFFDLVVSAAFDCESKPGSMNGGNPSGCPGAAYISGSPSSTYCSGYHKVSDTNSSLELWYPWWAACCHWTGSTCEPVCTDLDARAAVANNECCDEACVCRRNVTSDPCLG
jgi:hypothetical protein